MRTIPACLSVMFVLSGCSLHTLTPPPDFMPVQREDMGNYDVRTVSADGVVLGLRSQTTHSPGTLEFWSRAVANELSTNKGYRLVSSEDLAGAGGKKCKLMTFDMDLRGNKMTYVLALYVMDREIMLAEAGGKSEFVQKQQAQIRQSLLSVR